MEQSHHHSETHTLGYGLYIMVWIALVIFTGLTVAVSGINLKQLAVLTALVIAGTKTTLVLNHFMHLKYESRLFKWMVSIAIITFAIFLGLTFVDVLFR